MKQTDKAFWLTVIPSLILWNAFRPWLLHWILGNDTSLSATPEDFAIQMMANIVLSCTIGAAAGYFAAIIASPRYLKAAGNAAVGVTIAFGLQNILEYRAVGYPGWYFVLLPAATAGAAVLGGGFRTFQSRTKRHGIRRI